MLALAALLGWACGGIYVFPVPIVIGLGGFVAGGIMMNTMVMKLPRELEARIQYFLLGVVLYSGLLFAFK